MVVPRNCCSRVQQRFVPTPPAFDAPVKGNPRRNIAMTFGAETLEWFGYKPNDEKKLRYDTITRFDRIHERDRQTDTA